MASSVTGTTNIVSALFLNDGANATDENDNIFSGAKTIHVVDINNTHDAAVYVKLANVTNCSPGTTPADMVLYCPASTRLTYNIIGATGTGVEFGTGVSMWCVTAAAESNTADPGTGTVDVKIAASD